ncbi:MAG: hypothetical protein A2289_10255 [Deltaproteobacteria bacterium RIFOXYA12_FULL_58_15]|nr:MAG: hypothetical protein A2289_10255 [Deltaproteobacteria bacterium RIFOXYA12_FULL_58_15]
MGDDALRAFAAGAPFIQSQRHVLVAIDQNSVPSARRYNAYPVAAWEDFLESTLDWMLPDIPGIDLLREWREQGTRAPVIMLTARADLVDRVVGLELGANDYVTKPFEPRELLARIRVQLRQQQQIEPSESVLRFGGLELNRETREVRFRDDLLDLCRQEYTLLLLFMENPNRVFSREEILNKAWGYDTFPTTRTVDTHVLQLRQKTTAGLIETVRGIGYRLREPGDLAKS